MGTTDASGRVPWDVPVRLVHREDREDRSSADRRGAEVLTRPVDVGLPLPGVGGVVATTVVIDGTAMLSGIRPMIATDPDAPSPEPLARFLAALTDGDGRVRVLAEGTPFTLAVLTALSGIAPGERVTYAELAARAGRPRAVRAAAHVMATNRVPLVLPCHRVVPSGGGTGRYGWGDAVKPVLLAAERPAEATPAVTAGD
jgi:O-6-methylguanine DNA methyltransferase